MNTSTEVEVSDKEIKRIQRLKKAQEKRMKVGFTEVMICMIKQLDL